MQGFLSRYEWMPKMGDVSPQSQGDFRHESSVKASKSAGIIKKNEILIFDFSLIIRFFV